MDGLGYHNWGNKDNAYDDESDPSPPTYNSDQYAFSNEASPVSRNSNNKGRSTGNIYDYSIDNEEDHDYESSPDAYSVRPSRDIKASSFGKSNPSQRMSTEDRMKEILGRNDAEKKVPKKEEEVTNSWKSSWDDLLAGLNSPEPSKLSDESASRNHRSDQKKGTRSSGESPTDSSFGDFEISASDLEVLVLASHVIPWSYIFAAIISSPSSIRLIQMELFMADQCIYVEVLNINIVVSLNNSSYPRSGQSLLG